MSWHFYKTCSRCVLIFLWQLYCLYKCRTDVFDLFFRDLRDCNKRIRAFWRVGVLKCVHRALLYTTQCMHIYFLSCSCLTIVNVICHRTHNVMPTIKPYKKIGKKNEITPNDTNHILNWGNKNKMRSQIVKCVPDLVFTSHQECSQELTLGQIWQEQHCTESDLKYLSNKVTNGQPKE